MHSSLSLSQVVQVRSIKERGEGRERLTGEIPWLNLVEIDVHHGRPISREADPAEDLGC